MSSLWRHNPGYFLAGWYGFHLLADFTIEKETEDVNDSLLATMMDPTFARFFPWQTASQFLALRGIHFNQLNAHHMPLRWIDIWVFHYDNVWQNLTDKPDRRSWEADRVFFLQQCLVAKWLVNNGEHCFVHLMVDKEDTHYNHVDAGFFCFPVSIAPSIFIASNENHGNYPWGDDGERGWAFICQNYQRRCAYDEIQPPLKKQK